MAAVCVLAFTAFGLSTRRSQQLHALQTRTLEVLMQAHQLGGYSYALLIMRDNFWSRADQWRAAQTELNKSMEAFFAQDNSLLSPSSRAYWQSLRSTYTVILNGHQTTASILDRLRAARLTPPPGESLLSHFDQLLAERPAPATLPDTVALITQIENFNNSTSHFTANLKNLETTLIPDIAHQIRLTQLSAAALLGIALAAIAWLMRRIVALNRSLAADNTARRAAEQAARSSEKDLQITLDSIGDGVIATDTDDCITRINPVASQLTGWSAADAFGQPLHEVFHLLDVTTEQRLHRSLREMIARSTALPADHTDPVLIARDGTRRRITESAAPIRDTDGELRGAVLVFRDITEKNLLAEQVRQAQRLEPVGQLAAGVAHDFNNLLQAIRGNLALARDPVSTPAEQTEFLDNIERSSKRAAELTGQLLAFGRRQTLRKVVHDLNLLASDLLRLLNRVIGANIEVSFTPHQSPALALTDRSQIDQIMLNLCVNARDAMPEGGKLHLGITQVTLNETSSAALGGRPGKYYRLTVSDTGTGMDETVRRRIFEPFYTTKDVGRGTGLGLAVALGVVQQHQGFIQVESAPGQGSAFHVFLPAAPLGELEAIPHSGTVTTKPPAVPTVGVILLAEDNDDVRRFARLVLERAGYEVITAHDGAEALRLAPLYRQRLVCAVCDIIMPHLNGIEARMQLRQMRSDLPVILCSGYPGTQFTNQNLGPILTKPFTSEQLLAWVAAAIAGRPLPPPGA